MAFKTRSTDACELQVRDTLRTLKAVRRLRAAQPPVDTDDPVVRKRGLKTLLPVEDQMSTIA